MSQAKGGRAGAEEEPQEEARTGAGDGQASGATAGQEPGHDHGNGHECLEWCPVCRSAELLKGVTSPEIRQQLQSIQNEALQVFKAFAAAYTERAGAAGEDPFSRDRSADNGTRPGQRGPEEPPEPVVTDISIE